MHKEWLGEVYDWAGNYRSVNISKESIQFAAAKQIPGLMDRFEIEVLSAHTPCLPKSLDDIAEALAIVHVELVLIHPFREGNGRISRILSTLMSLQANLPLLDFGNVKGKMKEKYFKAVRNGFNRNYDLMKEIFLEVIENSKI